MDLARKIEEAVSGEPLARQKLWENVASALGSEFSDRLDRRFDLSYAERHLVMYAMGDVPKPNRPSDTRITGIRFKSDLSQVSSSLAGDSLEPLRMWLRITFRIQFEIRCCPMGGVQMQTGYVKSRDEYTDGLHERH